MIPSFYLITTLKSTFTASGTAGGNCPILGAVAQTPHCPSLCATPQDQGLLQFTDCKVLYIFEGCQEMRLGPNWFSDYIKSQCE